MRAPSNQRSATPKICEWCGQTFYPWTTSPNARFCGRSCLAYWRNRAFPPVRSLHPHRSPKEQTCEYCGKAFHPYSGMEERQGYCSRQCWKQAGQLRRTYICGYCGKTFIGTDNKGGHSGKQFCSRHCAGKNNNPEYAPKTITAVCAYCGQSFTRPNKGGHRKQTCCTPRCGTLHHQTISPRPSDPAKYIGYVCEECGKTFRRFASRLKTSTFNQGRFCSKQCTGLWAIRHQHLHKPTSIEKALNNALQSAAIVSIQEYPVSGFSIDLALPEHKIAIEVDGSYWHSLPEAIARDARKDAALKAAGWTVLRFSETAINTDVAACVTVVLANLKT